MKGTNSADRILSVLNLFTDGRLEWTAEQLMEALGYSRPTMYRYLRSLKDAGLLVSISNSLLTLGPRVVEMDFLIRKSDPLLTYGKVHIHQLARTYPSTALLARWYGDKMLCVDTESSTNNYFTNYTRGRPMALVRGAIARTIVANLPKAHLENHIYLHLEEFKKISLGVNYQDILESFLEVKKNRVCIAKQEMTPGVLGIASPIFDINRYPVGALCVTLALNAFSGSDLDAIAEDVKVRSEKLSKEMGAHS
jgi:DNA-binding IclR family transcriptional regulator